MLAQRRRCNRCNSVVDDLEDRMFFFFFNPDTTHGASNAPAPGTIAYSPLSQQGRNGEILKGKHVKTAAKEYQGFPHHV